MLMKADDALLLVVDMQEKLLPAIHDADAIEQNVAWLLDVASAAGVPSYASEQYRKGLGHTVPSLRERIPRGAIDEKVHFSCADAPECCAGIKAMKRRQLVICGVEAHVCVLQTALGMQQAGYEVFVVADAVGSRKRDDRDLALERLRALGVQVVSREMVAFEWMHQAGTDVFRTISRNYLR
jgi:nicotinamidase-related amidase